MNIFSSKAAIYTAPNRRTRFIPKTELSELFLTRFARSTGAFLKGARRSLGSKFGRAAERGRSSVFIQLLILKRG